MDLLSAYDDNDVDQTEANSKNGPLVPQLLSRASAPLPSHTGNQVALAVIPSHASNGAAASHASSVLATALSTGMMTANLPAHMMYAPIVGPVAAGAKGIQAGPAAESYRTAVATLTHDTMDPVTFAAQYNTYSTHGYAADPTGSGALVGNASRYAAANGQAPVQGSAQRYTSAVPGQKRARANNDDSADAEGYLGPWAGFDGERVFKSTPLEQGTLTLQQKLIRLDQGLNPYGPGKLEKEQIDEARAKVQAEAKAEQEAKEAAAAPAASAGGVPSAKQARVAAPDAAAMRSAAAGSAGVAAAAAGAAGGSELGHGILTAKQCKSTFHGAELFDYQGRSWMAPPKGVRPDEGEHECFVPKKNVHQWTGHGKGVNSVAFLPGTGHLLLSASLDGKAKVWDVAGNKGLRRTYSGHTGGVRQAVWCSDGRKFATVSFDRSAKIWDTETGACLASYSPGSTPLCAAWAPTQDDNVILTGLQHKRILQYDLRAKAGQGSGAGAGSSSSSAPASSEPSPDPTLEYDYHLGPVNAINFFDNGRRFMSAGDDRLLVWDYGTPVPIKHIADPAQHAVAAAAVSPDGGSWVGQSMDNSIVVFNLGDRIGRNMKKTFKGHVVAGYACQPTFSSDGRFLGSGDGDGNAWFWDWRSHRVLNKVRAHDNGPCMGMAWHPLQPAWVATCGWDGVIKLWE